MLENGGPPRYSLRRTLFADLKRNKSNTKGLFIVLLFRFANTLHFLGRKNIFIRLAGRPLLAVYKILTDYVLTVYLPPGLHVGRGLAVFHGYSIVVNENSVIGENVTLRQCITIGSKDLSGQESPEIGDDVDIGAGAIILGGVKIGRGSIIGAGSVVVRDVDPYTVVAGNPARLIRKLPGI